MNELKTFFKLLRYGALLNYHLKKQYKVDVKHLTVAKYHCEMAEHYFFKIYGYVPTALELIKKSEKSR